ncbi:swr complex subunit [Stygiomarasmius scandens]|uniref:SWR1-complex protein 4 n=1 Tax=Marasmiellus scandens TaxID=2682957 RepID=A0ABR1K0A0_9AGAR
MAASIADVRSALSISAPPSSTPGPSQLKKQSSQSARKPEGISRELYSLIGPSAPTLAAQLAKPRLKQKPNLGGGGKVKWEWRKFKNGARADSLELGHWVKTNSDPNADYPFAKYNVQHTVYSWTPDEYSRYLHDSEWTPEESEYLFKLAIEYDLRWYIIHDRYEYPGTARELEDLKDRYFSICRKLVRNRPWNGDEASRNQLLASFSFDKDREQVRKKYVANLENRNPDQILEEEALYLEIKRLEQNERKFKRDREELLRTLAGIDSGLPDIVEDEATFFTVDTSKLQKKKSRADLDSPSASLLPSMTRRVAVAKDPAEDAKHCIIRTELSATTPATKAAHTPAYMRSFKLPYPKAAIAPRVTQVLTELGISSSRLVMPTRDNCQRLESLMDEATTLVELKKAVDKMSQDIDVVKTRLDIRETGEEMVHHTETDMEMDERGTVEPEGEDGRAQSVVSTRSTRSRKHGRRSMSVSSVDTTATSSARPPTKRQKRG